MLPLATITGKTIILCLRLFGRKGSALPGLVIEKLYPSYLVRSLSQLPKGVIIVTGTNGKTTTTKVVSELFKASGLRVLSNPSGSNFVRGIVSTAVAGAKINGKIPFDIAVFEQDEAHGVQFVKRFKPAGVVALNVTRDQMDRFGEIDTTAQLIGEIVAAATDWVVLNANDRRIAALADRAKGKQVTWFAHSQQLLPSFLDDDQLHHSHPPQYFLAAQPQVMLKAIAGNQLDLNILGNDIKVNTPLDGVHNAINIAAVLATYVSALPQTDLADAVGALQIGKPAFGRGELIKLPSGSELRLQLVKNPASFKQSLKLLGPQKYNRVGIAINDDYADGRDVSWLWDVDFQALQNVRANVACGGVRAYDIATRLKYDLVKVDSVTSDFNDFLGIFFNNQPAQRAIIFCTYTAMLKLRHLLKKQNPQLAKEGI